MGETAEEEDLRKIISGKTDKKLKAKKLKLIIFLIIIILLGIVKFNLVASGEAKIVPLNKAVIRSPLNGILKELNYNEGDSVKKGDVIGHIENEERILQEKSKLQLTERKFNRSKWLYENEAASLEDFEKDKFNYEIALHEYQEIINRPKIISPISGVVLTREIKDKIGTFLKQGEIICEVGDIRELMLEVEIPENYAKIIKEGQDVLIKFEVYPLEKITGKVLDIAQKIEKVRKDDLAIKNIVVITVKLDTLPEYVKPNMSAKAKILYGRGNFLNIVHEFIKRHIMI